MADQMLADLSPPCKMVIIDSYSESLYLADQVLADLPPVSNGNYSFLLWELIFGRPGVGRSTPLHQMAIIDSYSESSYLADQMLADLPPFEQFHRFLLWQLIFHSYSESSYLADQVLADLPPM